MLVAVESVFGLPAHPLVVHGAVVVLPLAGLATMALAVPTIRRRLGLVVVASQALALVLAIAAVHTGGQLADEDELLTDELLSRHGQLGGSVPWLAGALLAIGVVAVLSDRRDRDIGRSPVVAVILGAALIAIGGVTVFRVAEVGHSGTASAWRDEADDLRDAAEDRQEDAEDREEDRLEELEEGAR